MDQKQSKLEDNPVLLNNAGEVITSLNNKKRNKRKIRNFLFSILWLYLIIKLFITDIDILIAESLGLENTAVYLILRFIAVSVILLLIWRRIGNKRFFRNLGWFILFPIYPGLWLIVKFSILSLPGFLITNQLHFILYSYVELLLNFFAEFKKSMLKIFAFITSFYILFYLDSYWLVISIALLFLVQLSHIHKRYRQTFTPIKILRMSVNTDIHSMNPFSIEKAERQIELESANKGLSEEQKIYNQMEQILLMCELSDVLGVKIKNILNNSTYLKSLFWKIIYSFIISIVLFGGINYALYKLDPSNFRVESIPNYFNFFYYSFLTIFPDGSDITPLTEIAKFIRMAGIFIGVVLNLLILVFYLTTVTEKYKKHLGGLIEYFEIYSKEAKEYLNRKYKSHPAEVIQNIKNESSKIKNFLMALDFLFGKKK